jgi:hypothetical protein
VSDERTDQEKPEQRTPLRRAGEPAQAGDEDRTSPFPYAEKFDEWVADETAPPDAGRATPGSASAGSAPPR